MLAESLAAMREQGICAVLSLTEEPLEDALLREFEMAYLHLPIADFTAPSLEQVNRAMNFLREYTLGEAQVLIHCTAGMGRTGTILACYLVDRGETANQAIQEVRWQRPGSIETRAQEEIIRDYEGQLKRAAARDSGETST